MSTPVDEAGVTTGTKLQITLQYFDSCPSWKTTAAHLSTLIDEGLDAAIRYELIDTYEAAVARGFRGSPTVLIDGVDAFAEVDAPFGLACRVYRTEDGYAGSPSISQLRRAIEAIPGSDLGLTLSDMITTPRVGSVIAVVRQLFAVEGHAPCRGHGLPVAQR